YGGPAPHVAPSDRQSSLRTKSVLGEISIAPSAPQRPAFVQPSLCGGFAPHKLLIRFWPFRTRIDRRRKSGVFRYLTDAAAKFSYAYQKAYPAQVTTRKFFGSMTRKLSVTEARNSGHRLGTCSRRKPRTASVNSR